MNKLKQQQTHVSVSKTNFNRYTASTDTKQSILRREGYRVSSYQVEIGVNWINLEDIRLFAKEQ